MANYSFDVSISGTTAVITFTTSRLPAAGTTAAEWRVFDVETEELVNSGYDDFEFDDRKAIVVITVKKLTIGNSYIIEVEYDGEIYSEVFDVESDTPSSFEWDIPKASGQPLRVSASEWNAFTNKINEFLKYKGKSTVSFTKAVSAGFVGRNVGTSADGLSIDSPKVISKKILCEAVDALNVMLPADEKISYPTGIAVDFLNNIVDKLNSIT